MVECKKKTTDNILFIRLVFRVVCDYLERAVMK